MWPANSWAVAATILECVHRSLRALEADRLPKQADNSAFRAKEVIPTRIMACLRWRISEREPKYAEVAAPSKRPVRTGSETAIDSSSATDTDSAEVRISFVAAAGSTGSLPTCARRDLADVTEQSRVSSLHIERGFTEELGDGAGHRGTIIGGG